VISYPSLSRQGDAFQHDPHIGPVNSLQFSPFHRNLFLTGGQDGSVRLYHLLEQTPLRQWEPSPPPSSAASGADGEGETDDLNPFAAISCVSFSYTRPTVFAVGTQDGYVYLFDLMETLSGPLTFLRLPLSGAGVGTGGGAGGGAGAGTGARGKRLQGAGAGVGYRPRVTGLAFNAKQRDLLSVCDSSGRVLVWKVGWNLANQKQTEMSFLEKLGNISSSDSASGERQEEAQQREEDKDRERERERDAKGTEED
jgi:WD40 repeat protein